MEDQKAHISNMEREIQDLKSRNITHESSPSSDDVVTYGDLEKRAQAIAEKIADERIQKVWKERDEATAYDRAKSKYSDFDDVVTPEMLDEYERSLDPEHAGIISRMGSTYDKAIAAYKALKPYHDQRRNKSQQDSERKQNEQKLAANASKPQGVPSSLPSSMQTRNEFKSFSEKREYRKNLWARMQHIAKQ